MLYEVITLNPTLLGYDEVRGILDATGWERIGLKRPTFEHDLQFDAAVEWARTATGDDGRAVIEA